MNLQSTDPLSEIGRAKGISTWDQLLNYIKYLPYGRNSDRLDFALVIQEQRGTCSSKHAFLKQIADRNKIPSVDLILGMYKMTEENTPGIGRELSKHQLAYIPEAHCYLKIEGTRFDFTHPKLI